MGLQESVHTEVWLAWPVPTHTLAVISGWGRERSPSEFPLPVLSGLLETLLVLSGIFSLEEGRVVWGNSGS